FVGVSREPTAPGLIHDDLEADSPRNTRNDTEERSRRLFSVSFRVFRGDTHSPNSFNCRRSTGPGAPVIRSRACLFFGKAIVSRMFVVPERIIVNRSRPSAIPPCGGAPYLSASSRKPNFA